MPELTSLLNIGAEMSRKLKRVGIGTAEELMAAGSQQAFALLKKAYPNVCLVHLYALEGAVSHTEYHALSSEKKRELKEFSDSLKT